MIVTNAPDYDFELLKSLLEPWPRNLAKQAIIFDSYALGVNRQAWLAGVMADYHTSAKLEHNALHDAQALRVGMLVALERGWKPK